MLMVPLFFLYEFSIFLSRMIWRRKRAAEEKSSSPGSPGGSGSPE
jgi:Sec-independent protein secretion pathway component TatC